MLTVTRQLSRMRSIILLALAAAVACQNYDRKWDNNNNNNYDNNNGNDNNNGIDNENDWNDNNGDWEEENDWDRQQDDEAARQEQQRQDRDRQWGQQRRSWRQWGRWNRWGRMDKETNSKICNVKDKNNNTIFATSCGEGLTCTVGPRTFAAPKSSNFGNLTVTLCTETRRNWWTTWWDRCKKFEASSCREDVTEKYYLIKGWNWYTYRYDTQELGNKTYTKQVRRCLGGLRCGRLWECDTKTDSQDNRFTETQTNYYICDLQTQPQMTLLDLACQVSYGWRQLAQRDCADGYVCGGSWRQVKRYDIVDPVSNETMSVKFCRKQKPMVQNWWERFPQRSSGGRWKRHLGWGRRGSYGHGMRGMGGWKNSNGWWSQMRMSKDTCWHNPMCWDDRLKTACKNGTPLPPPPPSGCQGVTCAPPPATALPSTPAPPNLPSTPAPPQQSSTPFLPVVPDKPTPVVNLPRNNATLDPSPPKVNEDGTPVVPVP